VRRGPKKGRYDRASIDSVLDRGLLAHVAFVDDGEPVCIPMLYARLGDRIYIHGSTEPGDPPARRRRTRLRNRDDPRRARARTLGVRAFR
jgi:hypothetical protein